MPSDGVFLEARGMVHGSPEVRPFHTRLDTWKSIAQYMGRSSRTVQRWHSIYRLPVHHLSGEAGSVYAYSDELDSWLRRRGRPESNEPPEFPLDDARIPAHQQFVSDFVHDPFNSSPVSPQARIRSAQCVFLAGKLWNSVSHRNLPAILGHYRNAIDFNPGDAAAFAGLSLGLAMQGAWGMVRPAVAYAAAMAALEGALRIEPGLPLARCTEAWLKTLSERDWNGARRGFDEVLEVSPSCTRAMNGRALLYIAEVRPEAASKLLLKAAQHTPLSSVPLELYSWSKYLSSDFAEAIEQVQDARATGQSGPIFDAVEALAINRQEVRNTEIDRLDALAASSPPCSVPWGALGYMRAVNGKHLEAREILARMTARMTSSSKDGLGREPYAAALVLIGLDEWPQAVDCLEQSYRNGSLWSLGFRSDPMLEALRKDPLHMHFFNKLGYPEAEELNPETDRSFADSAGSMTMRDERSSIGQDTPGSLNQP